MRFFSDKTMLTGYGNKNRKRERERRKKGKERKGKKKKNEGKQHANKTKSIFYSVAHTSNFQTLYSDQLSFINWVCVCVAHCRLKNNMILQV